MKVKTLVKAYNGESLEYHVYKEEYKEPNSKNPLLILKGKSISIDMVIEMWGSENVSGFDIRENKDYPWKNMIITIK